MKGYLIPVRKGKILRSRLNLSFEKVRTDRQGIERETRIGTDESVSETEVSSTVLNPSSTREIDTVFEKSTVSEVRRDNEKRYQRLTNTEN